MPATLLISENLYPSHIRRKLHRLPHKDPKTLLQEMIPIPDVSPMVPVGLLGFAMKTILVLWSRKQSRVVKSILLPVNASESAGPPIGPCHVFIAFKGALRRNHVGIKSHKVLMQMSINSIEPAETRTLSGATPCRSASLRFSSMWRTSGYRNTSR